jgi:hypothetical protein
MAFSRSVEDEIDLNEEIGVVGCLHRKVKIERLIRPDARLYSIILGDFAKP